MSAHAGREDDQLVVKIQGYGCKSGSVWDDGAYSDVKRLRINHDDEFIHCVHIEYIDNNGKPTWGAQHGSDEGRSTDMVDLDYPNQYLTSIHGYYRSFEGYIDHPHSMDGIKSLSFETNIRTWGPYGKKEGIKFSIPIMGAKIVGFHGWSSNHISGLRAIGVYVQPITKSKPQVKPQLKPQLKPQAEHYYFSLGRYGCEDGESWDETFHAIKQFIIHSDDQRIISIQMEYMNNEDEQSIWSMKHGGDGGSKSEVVLEYPNEQLITIEGYYDNSLDSKSPTNMIRSLTVKTNKNIYGPFGVQNGTKFSFPTDARLKVVGIHGRSDFCLNAIGLHAVLI